MQLRHDLHVLDAVCSLARPDPCAPDGYPLAAWCTPAMSQRFIDGVIPDALLALQIEAGAAVLALEVDEGTEHAPVIRAKLARYAEALNGRPGWHLVFVASEVERARWLVSLGRRSDGVDSLAAGAWVTTIDEVRQRGIRTPIRPLVGDPVARRLIDASSMQPVRLQHPVASDAWLRLMASGAGEDFAGMFSSQLAEIPSGQTAGGRGMWRDTST